eukprot:12117372-Alexandrium_andersonii.AAC.1
MPRCTSELAQVLRSLTPQRTRPRTCDGRRQRIPGPPADVHPERGALTYKTCAGVPTAPALQVASHLMFTALHQR